MNKLLLVFEFEFGDDKEYEVKATQNSAVYTKEVYGHLLELYHLVVWKSYSKEENT